MPIYVLDTETTGLYPPEDEIVEIAIIDHQGEALLNTLVKPVNRIEWPNAQRIHGISPEDVKSAPTLSELGGRLREILSGCKHLIIYNAAYDTKFIKEIQAFDQKI